MKNMKSMQVFTQVVLKQLTTLGVQHSGTSIMRPPFMQRPAFLKICTGLVNPL